MVILVNHSSLSKTHTFQTSCSSADVLENSTKQRAMLEQGGPLPASLSLGLGLLVSILVLVLDLDMAFILVLVLMRCFWFSFLLLFSNVVFVVLDMGLHGNAQTRKLY